MVDQPSGRDDPVGPDGRVQPAIAQAGDGTPIAYQRDGAGPPLLLLAGQANNHTWWNPVRADFAAGHTVLTLDWRGTGASGAPDCPYSIELFAADVIAVLDAAGIDRAHVYGTSMGGRVAQQLAARHPSRVDRLVLGCTSPGGRHAVERDMGVRRALIGPDADTVLRELMYTPKWLAEHPGPLTVLGDPALPPHARRQHLLASAHHDAWAVLPAVSAATLVLHGADDRLTPAVNADRLVERIPNARKLILPGARHAYFHEFAALATPAVLDHLAGRPGS